MLRKNILTIILSIEIVILCASASEEAKPNDGSDKQGMGEANELEDFDDENGHTQFLDFEIRGGRGCGRSGSPCENGEMCRCMEAQCVSTNGGNGIEETGPRPRPRPQGQSRGGGGQRGCGKSGSTCWDDEVCRCMDAQCVPGNYGNEYGNGETGNGPRPRPPNGNIDNGENGNVGNGNGNGNRPRPRTPPPAPAPAPAPAPSCLGQGSKCYPRNDQCCETQGLSCEGFGAGLAYCMPNVADGQGS